MYFFSCVGCVLVQWFAQLRHLLGGETTILIICIVGNRRVMSVIAGATLVEEYRTG